MKALSIFRTQIANLTGGLGGIQYSINKAKADANENPTI
jgi:hypothetical protein